MRLYNYSVGRIKEPELKYLAIVKNSKLIESCISEILKDDKVYQKKELYRVDVKKLIKTIQKCYKNNITKQEHEDLHEEIASLLGFCNYVKNKVHIKPFVIINKPNK